MVTLDNKFCFRSDELDSNEVLPTKAVDLPEPSSSPLSDLLSHKTENEVASTNQVSSSGKTEEGFESSEASFISTEESPTLKSVSSAAGMSHFSGTYHLRL